MIQRKLCPYARGPVGNIIEFLMMIEANLNIFVHLCQEYLCDCAIDFVRK